MLQNEIEIKKTAVPFVATIGLFLLNGIQWGIFSSRLAFIQEVLKLSSYAAVMGVLVCAIPIGGLISIIALNFITKKFSTLASLNFVIIMQAIGLLCVLVSTKLELYLSLGHSRAILIAGIAFGIFGFGYGGIQVIRNMIGIDAESIYKKSYMLPFQGGFSLGMAFGVFLSWLSTVRYVDFYYFISITCVLICVIYLGASFFAHSKVTLFYKNLVQEQELENEQGLNADDAVQGLGSNSALASSANSSSTSSISSSSTSASDSNSSSTSASSSTSISASDSSSSSTSANKWLSKTLIIAGALLAVVCFSDAIASDWIMKTIMEKFNAPEETGIWYRLIYTLGTVCILFLGFKIVALLGRANTIILSFTFAFCGILIFLLSANSGVNIAGSNSTSITTYALIKIAVVFGAFLWGAGLALVPPVIISSTSDLPKFAKQRLFFCTGCAYVAYILGPAYFGFAVDRIGYFSALKTVVVPIALALVFSVIFRKTLFIKNSL